MKIGLDLSVIQTPHRMRGIGATAINFVNNIPDNAKKQHTFVIYLYERSRKDALSLLKLGGLNYEIRTLSEMKKAESKLPSALRILSKALKHINERLEVLSSDNRTSELDDIDVFLQFDQMQVLPKRSGLKTVVILYDLIPYIMEKDYLWSYKTARQYKDSRKASIRKALLRRQYLAKARAVAKSADVALAISQHTKQDFIKYGKVNASKIKVVHLGIHHLVSLSDKKAVSFERYLPNSWGFFKKPITLTNKPFLLFVGGADPRRRLNDLVGAYNNLKAQGHDIRLVLAGDTMKGADAIPVPETKKYIASSSYLDDIIFLGFVTDEQREWLYSNALSMVYPSVYEGFGLPILEAMQYGTPVITYKNSSIYEIAEDAALYADDMLDIKDLCEKLLENEDKNLIYSQSGKKQAAKFSWLQTVENIFSAFDESQF